MSRNRDEINFQEALNNSFRAYAPISPPIQILELLDDFKHEAKKLTSSSSNFKVLLYSLKVYIDTHGTVPLPGNIPDMTSTSQSFIELQKVSS